MKKGTHLDFTAGNDGDQEVELSGGEVGGTHCV